MSKNNSDKKESIGRRSFVKILGSASLLALNSCLGSFYVKDLGYPSDYDITEKDFSEFNFAYINAADMRGNFSNIFHQITKEEALNHARTLAEILNGIDFGNNRKLDFFCGTEFDYKESIKTGNLDQPEVLARFMGKEYHQVVFDEFMKFPFPVWTTGNTIISKHKMKAIYRHPYGKTVNGEPGFVFDRLVHLFKDFIHVEADFGKRRLDFLVTHLSDDMGSELQTTEANELLNYVTKLYNQNCERYMVVTGDFNCMNDSKQIEILSSNGILVHPRQCMLKTYPSDKPIEDIDHIFTTANLTIKDMQTFHFPYSDHRGLRGRISFK